MVFSSMTFLFAFLPVVVLVYMLSPKQMKNAILLIASLFFYAWGEPRNILLMLLSIGINYVFGRIIEADRASQSKMRVWNLFFAVLWNVLILGIFKYVSGISQTLHTMLPSLIPVVKRLHFRLVFHFIHFRQFPIWSMYIEEQQGHRII